ncbi:chitin synthase chs-1-like [Engystomops pustulosus]|uniref:chitin synthase chs-1-like n=1 Tax=Engystomops pustulosus TaxID=76066 RepID=UPI003AFB7678
MLLVDRLRMYPGVGAACGRIHPTGMGPMVWYQKFEYAVGHWLQKSSEHIFGCVLCSPGCFSLFRASALMDDNVLKTYSKRATSAMEYVQYDQGEDRWLCTLLLQQGWRVEYNAASDAYTNAPQVFDEFYNQRRRWSPSTMANTLDLLHSGRQTSKKNPSISYLYVLYQIFSMASSIISPATVCLMIAGSLSFLFQWDSNGCIVLAILPPALYTAVCYIAKPSTQIKIAVCLSICYAFLMLATILTIIGDIVKQGTIMTPTGLFLISMSTIYILTALLHPQEFYLLIYGLVYTLCVPSGYLILTIYSLVNMHIVSWGTRETVAPKDKPKEKTKKLKYQKTCKCLCWNVEVQVHDEKCNIQEEKKDIIDAQTQTVDAKREQNQNNYENEVNNIKYEESWISELQLKTEYNILKMENFDEEEIPFWEGVITKYLEPINEDKHKQDMIQRELKSLRNKVTFIIFMINLLWIVATFFLQIIGKDVHLVLPKIYMNGTISETEHLSVDPIGFMFLLSFALLIILQFGALLYHSGQILSDPVRYCTKPLSVQVGVLHKERLSFYVLPRSTSSVLLGLPWLQLHTPVLDWRTGEILRWGPDCQSRCVKMPHPVPVLASSVAPKVLEGLPACYKDYYDVFSKKQAETLPPHRPYDCPVDLLPGMSPPRGRVYPLSVPETAAMSEYIQENLQRGFILTAFVFYVCIHIMLSFAFTSCLV